MNDEYVIRKKSEDPEQYTEVPSKLCELRWLRYGLNDKKLEYRAVIPYRDDRGNYRFDQWSEWIEVPTYTVKLSDE